MIQDLLRSRHGEDEFTTEVCRNRSQWRVAGAESHCTETVQLLYTLYSATASVQLNCTFRRIKSLSSESRHIIIIYTLTLWHKIPICREVQYNKAVSDIQEYNRSHGYVDCFSPSFHKTEIKRTDWLNIKHRTSVSIMPSEFNSCDWMDNDPVHVEWWQW